MLKTGSNDRWERPRDHRRTLVQPRTSSRFDKFMIHHKKHVPKLQLSRLHRGPKCAFSLLRRRRYQGLSTLLGGLPDGRASKVSFCRRAPVWCPRDSRCSSCKVLSYITAYRSIIPSYGLTKEASDSSPSRHSILSRRKMSTSTPTAESVQS